MVKYQYYQNREIPLCGVEKCRYKICRHKDDEELKTYKVDKPKYLQDTDKYWADFLRSQQKSSANYLYKFQIYGDQKDRTQFKKEAFPPKLIHQRLLHMPVIGSLDKRDLHYLLSFILNLVKLDTETQNDFMESGLQSDILDIEILNYIKILTRHPTTGLKSQDRDNLLKICSKLLMNLEDPCDFMYFNPDHIFTKSLTEMDPYELEYLRDIRNSEKPLDLQKYFYLLNFMERLQEMNITERDRYLRILYDKRILPSAKLANLLQFIVNNSKKINHTKLRVLLGELEKFMDIDLCTPRPLDPDEDAKKEHKSAKAVDVDPDKMKKMMASLMKGGVMDLSKLNDLKFFLKDLMHLSPEELEKALKDLMASGSLSPDQLKLIQNMLMSGELGGDPAKRKLFMQMLNKANDPASNLKAQEMTATAKVAEAKAKIEAEAKAKNEAEAKAKIEAEAKAKIETEAKAKIEAETKAKIEAETKAKIEAETKAKIEAKTKAKLEAETKAKFEAKAQAETTATARAAEAKQDKENQQRDKEEMGSSLNDKDYKAHLKDDRNNMNKSNHQFQKQSKENAEASSKKYKEGTQTNGSNKLNQQYSTKRCVETQSFIDFCPLKSLKRKPSTYKRSCCLCTCDGMIIYP